MSPAHEKPASGGRPGGPLGSFPVPVRIAVVAVLAGAAVIALWLLDNLSTPAAVIFLLFMAIFAFAAILLHARTSRG